MTTCEMLLEQLEMPRGVAEVVVGMYARQADGARRLAWNPSSAAALAEAIEMRRAAAYTLEGLMIHGGARALESVLASREMRRGTLEVIEQYWELSEADQLRLVDRSIGSDLAGSWLINSDLGPGAKARLMALAGETAVAGWLLSHQGSDDEVYELVVAHAGRPVTKRLAHFGARGTLAMVLAQRGSLIERAAKSGVPELVEVAAALGISEVAAQRTAAEHLMTGGDTARVSVASMLMHPDLDTGLRDELTTWMHEHGGCDKAYYLTELGSEPMSDRDHDGVNRLRSARRAWEHEIVEVGEMTMRVSWACALAELVKSGRIKRSQGADLEDEIKAWLGERSPLACQLWLALQPRLMTTRMAFAARERSGCGRRVAAEWRRHGRAVGEIVEAPRETRPRNLVENTPTPGDPAGWSGSQARQGGVPAMSGKYLADRLGNGTETESQERWRIFFTLAGEGDERTLEELSSAAQVLAGAQ